MDDFPIMQWIPFIKKIQKAGKSGVVDVRVSELEDFIGEMDTKGLFLYMRRIRISNPILLRFEKW